jgi:hypothetical protein
MKRFFLLPLLALTFGCAQNHFNIPKETFADKVKVLGVAPIMIDANSDIRHPRKDDLVALINGLDYKYEPPFVRNLKSTGNFYTVMLLDGDPQNIFANLYFRTEKRDDATIQYNKYFWKTDELRDYLRRNNLDAVMLIVVSGLSKIDKISSPSMLSSLTSEYNYLIMTAQILDANGAILWEYPNFRGHILPLPYEPLLNLQYPDFSEADANLSAKAEVKFKTIEGIKRILDQKRKDLLLRETKESEVYGKHFDEMISVLKYDLDKKAKEQVPVERPAPRTEQPSKAPATTLPVQPAEQPAAPAPAIETPNPSPDEIVPATGNTR